MSFILKNCRDTARFEVNAEYTCHRAAPRTAKETIQAKKSTKCATQIWILIKKDSEKLRQNDPFAEKGRQT